MAVMYVAHCFHNEYVLSKQVEYKQWMELILTSCNSYHSVQELCSKQYYMSTDDHFSLHGIVAYSYATDVAIEEVS